MDLKNVLVVDDDKEMADFLNLYLEGQGFKVFLANNAAQARSILQSYELDLILLDLVMPGESGLDVLQHIRKASQVPIIVLSGKTDETDKVVCLELGADDYISKPFGRRELLARMRSILRRSVAIIGKDGINTPQLAIFCDCKFNPESHELFGPDGKNISLTESEFKLLLAFAKSPSKVISRDSLLDILYAQDSDRFDRSIDVQILRLRRKLPNEDIIKTVRGAGYMFTAQVVWQ